MASPNGPFSDSDGLICFGNMGVFLGRAILKSGKHGQAEGHFFLKGFTEGGGPKPDVSYLLSVIGEDSEDNDAFVGVWPPSGVTVMNLDTWELTADGESSAIRNISCLGDGGFDDFPLNGLAQGMTITVTLVEPEP